VQRGVEGCKRRRNENSEKSRASETEMIRARSTSLPPFLPTPLLSLSLSLFFPAFRSAHPRLPFCSPTVSAVLLTNSISIYHI
jgi:hypothetical protein